MRSARHRGVTKPLGPRGQGSRDGDQIAAQVAHCLTHLQDQRRVHHVLSRRAEMDVARGFFSGDTAELRDQPHHRIADLARARGDALEIQVVEPGRRSDRFGD